MLILIILSAISIALFITFLILAHHENENILYLDSDTNFILKLFVLFLISIPIIGCLLL